MLYRVTFILRDYIFVVDNYITLTTATFYIVIVDMLTEYRLIISSLQFVDKTTIKITSRHGVLVVRILTSSLEYSQLYEHNIVFSFHIYL